MTPPYVLPTFNLQALIWHNYDPTVSVYTAGWDDRVICNLTPGKRVMLQTGNPVFSLYASYLCYLFPMQLLCTPLADLRAQDDANIGDLIECPRDSGRLYFVTFVDDIAKGFANEHRFAILHRCAQPMVFTDTTVGIPIPLS